MSDETVRFSVLCAMFQAMLRDRSAAKRRRHLRTFLDRVFTVRDSYFAALRLILPGLDRERGTYGLKESALAACLIDALGIAKDSEDALRLVNWRKGGARSGANAGNFSLVAAEVMVEGIYKKPVRKSFLVDRKWQFHHCLDAHVFS